MAEAQKNPGGFNLPVAWGMLFSYDEAEFHKHNLKNSLVIGFVTLLGNITKVESLAPFDSRNHFNQVILVLCLFL